jgi:hypothetical protein
MHKVKKINQLNGYKISLTFEDKKTKIIDVEPYLDEGIFLSLLDLDYFNLVQLEHGTIVWPNEADFCADVLYEIGKEVTPTKSNQKGIRKKRKQIARNLHAEYT